MATLATLLRRPDFMTGEMTRELEQVDPYRLRTLPGDHLYFYSKRIDNSRLVREADPKTRTNCWSAIATACLLAAMVGTAVSPHIGGVLSGYQMEKLKAEQRELLDQHSMLQIEEAQLLSPARLDELAAREKMAEPGPGQELHLQPKDSALAMNEARPVITAQ